MPRLTPQERTRRRAVKREIIRRALDGQTSYALAKEYPVSRQTIDQYVEEARRDPEAAYLDAVDEADYRREIRDTLRLA